MQNTSTSYICPVCGAMDLADDRFPVCYYCKNTNVILVNNDELNNLAKDVETWPKTTIDKYLYFEKKDEVLYNNFKTHAQQEKFSNGIICREYLRQKYVFNNPAFSKEKYNDRVNQEYEEQLVRSEQARENARRAAEEASRPRCPKCGCTEFQMVPRKWSPLTGFLTNKVDRVCVKCKTRF